MKATIRWVPQDMWIGLFWRAGKQQLENGHPRQQVDLWICLVPCVPLHLTWERKR